MYTDILQNDIIIISKKIKQKLIVKTKDEIENTYGANSVYYYTVGNYQILFYDTAEEAKNACEKLKKDLPGTTIFQDIPITLKEAIKTQTVRITVRKRMAVHRR